MNTIDFNKHKARVDFEKEIAELDRSANRIYIVNAMFAMNEMKHAMVKVPDCGLAMEVLSKLDEWLGNQLKELNTDGKDY